METIIIHSKSKTTSKHIKRLIKEMDGVESVSTLSDADKEDLAMINAINIGRKGNYDDTAFFLKKIRGK
jgi:hypothetical protein